MVAVSMEKRYRRGYIDELPTFKGTSTNPNVPGNYTEGQKSIVATASNLTEPAVPSARSGARGRRVRKL